MINEIKLHFPQAVKNNCFEKSKLEEFWIEDCKITKKCSIIKENGEFKVKNNTDSHINFLAVDECTYNSNDSKRSDCIIFNDNIFCFIELKICSLNNAKANRKKAEKQLESSIKTFTSKLSKLNKLEAYVCLNCRDKEDNLTRITKSSSPEKILYFENELNTSLYYKCDKEFN
jgi:hypothetical protein